MALLFPNLNTFKNSCETSRCIFKQFRDNRTLYYLRYKKNRKREKYSASTEGFVERIRDGCCMEVDGWRNSIQGKIVFPVERREDVITKKGKISKLMSSFSAYIIMHLLQ
jgi:hypothetical protein